MEVVEDEIGAALELDANEEYMNEDYMQDIRRVKVYELAGQNWRDLGTAFCSGEFDETIREAQLIAKSEESQEILLQITVRADDVYQRQADTLIVWTEPNGQDYALSFQDVEGCTEVWDFITEVRRHLRAAPGDDPSSSFHDPIQTMQPIRLPEPTLGNLGDIERQIRAVHRLGQIRERVAENIVSMDMVKKLVALMRDAEDLQSISDLHALCTLMQAILLLNDQGVYEHILRDDIFVDMVGLMEYDPDFPRLKAHYRDFLRDNAKYHQVIEFRDQGIQTKVHQTYRLLYLKDVVLARILDDPMFNILNSLIIFHQIDIITYIQSEEYFLREMFSIFLQHPRPPTAKSEEGAVAEEEEKEQTLKEDKRAPALLLLHQFCSMGKNVQLPLRISLFRSLVDRGILYPVQWALTQSDIKVLNTAGEILAMVLDHDAGGVRGYILRQVEENARREGTVTMTQQQQQSSILGGLVGALASTLSTQPTPPPQEPASSTPPQPTLLMLLCSIITNPEHEISLKTQLAESFKTLMDVPGLDGNLPGLKLLQPALRKDEQSDRFLEYFYTNCAEDLYKPILTSVPEHKTVQAYPLQLTRAQSDLYLYLCDLLSGFLLQHSYQSHFFVTTKNLAPRIASLLYAREKHLRLAALRFFRTCLRLNNNSVLLHLTRNEVFSPILELTKRESSRDNLLSSCCQEFFEHIRRENVKDVMNHIMKTREPLVRQLATSPVVGERFRGLIQRWEINNEPPPKVEIKPTPNPPKRWGTRAVDAEDAYFNADEDEGGATARQTRGQGRKRGMPTGVAGNAPPRRTQRPTGVAIPRAYPMALVDYQEEDESNEPAAAASPSTSSGKPSDQQARTRGRTRRTDLARTASSATLDPNAPGTAGAASPTASTSAGDQPMSLLSQRRNATTEIGPVAMDEDDDLIGPPISLSHKRRRDTEEEDEAMERLAKRPALGHTAEKTDSSPSSSSSPAGAASTSTVSTAANGSAETAVMEAESSAAEPARGTKRPVRVKLSNALLSTPPADVKVGDKG